ncbi:MAG TPA: DUF2703 domain-containing protein [Clostridia bacterium]|nr:DUF2703 domain-containing protein [Clostridia bacterium]
MLLDVDCRVFEYNGETYEVPPKEMIANDLMTEIFILIKL